MHRADTEHTLDGRDERRALEKRARQRLDRLENTRPAQRRSDYECSRSPPLWFGQGEEPVDTPGAACARSRWLRADAAQQRTPYLEFFKRGPQDDVNLRVGNSHSHGHEHFSSSAKAVPNTSATHTGALLGLDEARGTVDAHNEAARHLGVEGAAVTRLFGTQDPAHPRNNLVRRRVRGLVQVDHTIPAVPHARTQRTHTHSVGSLRRACKDPNDTDKDGPEWTPQTKIQGRLSSYHSFRSFCPLHSFFPLSSFFSFPRPFLALVLSLVASFPSVFPCDFPSLLPLTECTRRSRA